MNKAYESVGGILDGKVKIKHLRRDPKAIRSRIKRITSNATEVMVKITGNTKGSNHTQAHLEYISRKGDVPLENERGEVLEGINAVSELNEEWKQDQGKRKVNTRDTTNIVLSMPPSTDPTDVHDSVRDFAKKQFSDNYQYVFALHTDEQHPHVHLTVKNHGFDGRRLHVKKGDPQIWREGFAEKLRNHGVDAEATPRAVRGVIRKGVSQAVLQMRDRGLKPAVDEAKIHQIVEEVRLEREGKEVGQKPWEEKIKDRQTTVRKTWLQAAKDLSVSSDQEDREVGKTIFDFVSDMPKLETERHLLRKQLADKLHDKSEDRNSAEKER